MADESNQPDALVHTTPSFGGMWRFVQGRLGRPKPPKRDPSKVLITFQPQYRVVVWNGEASEHITDECALLCEKPGAYGEHSEVRPNGFNWEGTYFHGLYDALENQAFRRWYESGGREVLEQGELTVRAPQYVDGKKLPLPRFNFFLHENVEEMTAREIIEYRRSGEVPKHLRRRGRNKPKPEVLEEE